MKQNLMIYVKKIVDALESQVTESRCKALPIEFHIDVNDERVKTLCHQSRYGLKFERKGFCDNASTIINMMGLGLIVISNRTRMTNPIFSHCSPEELPLVLFDTSEPEAEILLQTLLKLNEDLTTRQRILKNLERVMTTLFDPMDVAARVAEVLKKTLSLPKIDWTLEEQAREWCFAREKLIQEGVLRQDGHKLSRKQYPDFINHSFIIIDRKMIALSGKGNYLGAGINGHAKLAADEHSHLMALKVITNEKEAANSAQESEVAQDLGIAGQRVTRTSSSKKHPLKHYIAYQFLGVRLFDYLNKHKASLDKRYEIGIKIALALHELHTGKKSQSKESYIHGDIHGKNIVVDEQGNPHFIDFGRAKPWNGTYDDLWRDDIVKMLHVFFTPFPDRIRWYTDWIFGDWMGEYQFEFCPPPETPSKQTIYIYLNPEDINECGLYLSFHYAVFDTSGTFQNKIIQLQDLGISPLSFENLKFDNEIKKVLEKKVREITDSNGDTTSVKNRNEFLFDLLKKPTDFLHSRDTPTALDVAEVLTLCRFGLNKYQSTLIGLPAETRLNVIHTLITHKTFPPEILRLLSQSALTSIGAKRGINKAVGERTYTESLKSKYTLFQTDCFTREKFLSTAKQDSHFAASILDVIKNDSETKIEIAKAAQRLSAVVIAPILQKFETNATLNAEEEQSIDFLITEHSLDDPQWEGLMHDYSTAEIRGNLALQKELLRRFLATMDPEKIEANTDVKYLREVMKAITDCSFCYVEKLARKKEGPSKARFKSIYEWIMPTEAEIDMRVRRTPEHLAMTSGLDTMIDTDIALRSTIKGRAYRAGKAAFAAADVYQKARQVVAKYDAAVEMIGLEGNLPIPADKIQALAEAKTELKTLEKKMVFYKIPLKPAERSKDFIERVPIPGIQHLANYGANSAEGPVLPLIAGASSTAARVLIALHVLDFFHDQLGIFQSKSAGYIATALCGSIVDSGHHSVLEVGEIYNRLIDYEAVRYLDTIAPGEDTGLREKYMPYYHIGFSGSLLPESLRERVYAEFHKKNQSDSHEPSTRKGVFI